MPFKITNRFFLELLTATQKTSKTACAIQITTCHHVFSEGFHTDLVYPLTDSISQWSMSEVSSCTEVWHVTMSVVLIAVTNRISLRDKPAAFLFICLSRLIDIDLWKDYIFSHRCHLSCHFLSSVFPRGGSYLFLSGQSGHRGHDLTMSMNQSHQQWLCYICYIGKGNKQIIHLLHANKPNMLDIYTAGDSEETLRIFSHNAATIR